MTRVPRPKNPEELQQVSVMLPRDWIERMQKIAKNMGEPGATTTRADVLRMCVRRGLEALEATARPKRGG